MACSRVSPHISRDGRRLAHTAGLSGCPKILQRLSSSSWMQRTPAGFPFGMPGMAEEIEGAVQQAPQAGRQAGASGGEVMRQSEWAVRSEVYSERPAIGHLEDPCYNR
jgi:hypothetical protein